MNLPELLAALVLGTVPSFGAALGAQGQSARITAQVDTPEVHLARGHDDLENHRYQQAEAEFRAALAINPRLTVRARFPLAVTLFALQRRVEARKEFEAVRSETGDEPNVNYYLGRLDLDEGKLDSAIANLTIAASRPPFPDTAYYLGCAYLKKRDSDSAEKWLRKAAALDPRDPRVPERLAILYHASGREADAEKAFAESSQLRQGDLAATQQALDCDHSLEGQSLDKARQTCQKLFDPGDFGGLVTLGLLYGQHHDYAEALEPFRAAARLDPDSYEVDFDLGLTYFRLKRYAEARVPLEQAAALRPDLFEVNAPLGAALYALGDDAAAYPVLDNANRLNPRNGDISRLLFQTALNLASQSLGNHNAAKARQYLLRASDCSPDNPEPYRRLADLDESRGAHSEAQREREQADRLTSH